MDNTEAFQDALDRTMQHLSDRGVMLKRADVADVIQRSMAAGTDRFDLHHASAWDDFDPAAVADSLAPPDGSGAVGEAPLPPLDNPELALILGAVPEAVAASRGDLYAVIMMVALKAWAAGHIHGEDGCGGCTHRGEFQSPSWAARMAAIGAQHPGVEKYLDVAAWNALMDSTGYRLRSD